MLPASSRDSKQPPSTTASTPSLRSIPADGRRIDANVASPAALVVAKVHKVGERHDRDPGRLLDKDAHDLYRLLRAVDTDEIAAGLTRLRSDRSSAPVTGDALRWLRDLAADPAALIPTMAGRTEQSDSTVTASSAKNIAWTSKGNGTEASPSSRTRSIGSSRRVRPILTMLGPNAPRLLIT